MSKLWSEYKRAELIYDDNGQLDEIRIGDNPATETILEIYTDGYFHVSQLGEHMGKQV